MRTRKAFENSEVQLSKVLVHLGFELSEDRE